MAIQGLRNWCTPAYVYFVISAFFIFIVAIQNYYTADNKVYCIGMYSCDVPNTTMIFILKIIYILFWTWILNLICRAGAPALSWFLVLFPLVLMFVLIGGMILY